VICRIGNQSAYSCSIKLCDNLGGELRHLDISATQQPDKDLIRIAVYDFNSNYLIAYD
jgi:hypothetical protein